MRAAYLKNETGLAAMALWLSTEDYERLLARGESRFLTVKSFPQLEAIAVAHLAYTAFASSA
jgi:hypothetical protein